MSWRERGEELEPRGRSWVAGEGQRREVAGVDLIGRKGGAKKGVEGGGGGKQG